MRLKMKQIILMLSVLSLLMVAACQPVQPSEPTDTGGVTIVEDEVSAPEDVVEPVVETAEDIEADLDTSSLDELEEDLDLLILE